MTILKSRTIMNRTVSAGQRCLILTCVMMSGCDRSDKSPNRDEAGTTAANPPASAAASDDEKNMTGTKNSVTLKSPTSRKSEDRHSRDTPVFRFESMLATSGIDFVQTSGNSKDKPFPAANGTGAGAIDIDADGALDLYFANGTTFPLAPDSPGPWDRLYRNHGHWKFKDITQIAGIGEPGYSCGVAVGDFDNDGFADLYVNRYGANLLYRNLGDGTFEECAAASGVADSRWGTSTTFVDYNEDGLADLYVCNYGKWTWETSQFCGDPVRDIRMFCSPTHVEPEDDVLFANQGDGTFQDVSADAGVRVRAGRGQGVIAADVNGDSHVDLYVANDIHPNFLFLNRGGRFDENGEATGTALDHLGKPQAGMGLAAADVNADGQIDLFVTNYQNEHNALYLNLGNETFLESGLSRVPEGSLPWVGWGVAFADMNLDGQPDLFVTNGHTDDNLAELGREGDYEQPAGLWQNLAGQFHLASADGPYFSAKHVGRGLVSGDLDNDGDTDFAVCHQDHAPELLQNQTVADPQSGSVTLLLRSYRGNRRVTGATIYAGSGTALQAIPVTSGGSYASSPDERVILASNDTTELSLAIRWCNTSANETIRLQTGGRYILLEEFGDHSPARVLTLPPSF
ncbi:MAG: VCBS repeat-containing protein [Planctomycetaceae bacterium]